MNMEAFAGRVTEPFPSPVVECIRMQIRDQRDQAVHPCNVTNKSTQNGKFLAAKALQMSMACASEEVLCLI